MEYGRKGKGDKGTNIYVINEDTAFDFQRTSQSHKEVRALCTETRLISTAHARGHFLACQLTPSFDTAVCYTQKQRKLPCTYPHT